MSIDSAIVIGVAGIGGTLAAGLGAAWLQGRQSFHSWRRDQRYLVYTALVHYAAATLAGDRELAETFEPYSRVDENEYRPPRPSSPPFDEMFLRRAQLELIGDEDVKMAWNEYMVVEDRIREAGFYDEENLSKIDFKQRVEAGEKVIRIAQAALSRR